jgi:Carboxypeptidase regulatory-like domain
MAAPMTFPKSPRGTVATSRRGTVPTAPSKPRFRWWWLGVVAAIIAVAFVAWPRAHHKKNPPTTTTGARINPRPVITHGPNGWQLGPRQGLGPIAMHPVPDGLVRVTGSVLDRMTHKPVPDVEVVFADGTSESSATSDVAGRYSIDVPVGHYLPYVRGDGVISAGHPVRERLPGRPRPDQVAAARLELVATIDVSSSTDGIDLEVVRSGKIHGRVIDQSGRPIAGAIVRANPTDDGEIARPILGTDVAETDSAGGFELEVAATTYSLDAFHGRFGGIAAVTVVAVQAGATAETELTMMSGCMITGRVVRLDGSAVTEGALERGVSATDADGSFFPDGDFASDGVVEWSTTEETTVYLRAWPWKSSPSKSHRFECKDGAHFDNVVFEIPSAQPDMMGRVVSADGRPIPYAFVDVGGVSEGTMNQQERADGNGNFAVYALPRGQYQVTASADGFGVVEADVTSPNAGVVLTMSGTGTIAGSVLGVSDGVATVSAVACSSPSNGNGIVVQFRRVVSITGGHYRLDNVPACSLDLIATHGVDDLQLHVDVTPGTVATLDLDFPDDKPVLVRGVVRTVDGRPAPRTLITVASRTSDGDLVTATTDDGGRFSVSARGGDTIVARSDDGAYASQQLDAHGPATVEIDLKLEAPERFEEFE